MPRKLIGTILAIALVTNLCGCAALKRKFTRKKKASKLTVYYALENYAKEYQLRSGNHQQPGGHEAVSRH